MMNHNEPPHGSTITVERSGGDITLSWKRQSGGQVGISPRYLLISFLVIWLCGWAVGFVLALYAIFFDNEATDPFIYLWLGGWTVAGSFTIFAVRFLLRSQMPEKLRLGKSTFYHDSGSNIFAMFNPWHRFRDPAAFANPFSMVKARKIVDTTRSKIGNLRLADSGNSQYLTYDMDADRLEIGPDLRPPEREWLANILERWHSEPITRIGI
jgi:hypothetical protein